MPEVIAEEKWCLCGGIDWVNRRFAAHPAQKMILYGRSVIRACSPEPSFNVIYPDIFTESL
jgi:hypothetical protein